MTADWRKRTTDQGFTLIELIAVMSIGGTLALIGAFGFTNYRSVASQRGSSQEMVSQLRNTSERAISEGRTYCLDVAATRQSYTLWRYACGGSAGTLLPGTHKTQSSKVTLVSTVTNPSPTPACPSGDSCLYFYPRGTAIPATVNVVSTARSKVYSIRVEGLTARVYS